MKLLTNLGELDGENSQTILAEANQLAKAEMEAREKERLAKAEESPKSPYVGPSNLEELIKAKGPFIGPRGGKWADPAHTIPWTEGRSKAGVQKQLAMVQADLKEAKAALYRAKQQGNPRTIKLFGDRVGRLEYAVEKLQGKKPAEKPKAKPKAKKVSPSQQKAANALKEGGLKLSKLKAAGVTKTQLNSAVKAGLVWKGPDGAYRLTSKGDEAVGKTRKSEEPMDGIQMLEELNKAQTMPEGNPKQKLGQGNEQGGKLAGAGKQSGSGNSDPAPGMTQDGKFTQAQKVGKDKLSEDDEEDEKQMKEHKKPIEKSFQMLEDFAKAKYKRRWRGKDGKWQYEYDGPKKKRERVEAEQKIKDWQQQMEPRIAYDNKINAAMDAVSSGLNAEDRGNFRLAESHFTAAVNQFQVAVNAAPSAKLKRQAQQMQKEAETKQRQMEAAKKKTEKSMLATPGGTTPTGQREMVAREHAAVVSTLQKGQDDIEVGVGIGPSQNEPESLQKAYHQVGHANVIHFTNESDLAVTALLEKSEENGLVIENPKITRNSALTQDGKVCINCRTKLNKSLSKCPTCGTSQETPLSHAIMSKSEFKGPGLQPVIVQDVIIPEEGIALDD